MNKDWQNVDLLLNPICPISLGMCVCVGGGYTHYWFNQNIRTMTCVDLHTKYEYNI